MPKNYKNSFKKPQYIIFKIYILILFFNCSRLTTKHMFKKLLKQNGHNTSKKEKKKYTKIDEEQKEDSIVQLSKDLQNHYAFHNDGEINIDECEDEIEEQNKLINTNNHTNFSKNGTNNTKNKIFPIFNKKSPINKNLSLNSAHLETFDSKEEYEGKLLNLKIKRDKIKRDIKYIEKCLPDMEKYFNINISYNIALEKLDKIIKERKEAIRILTKEIDKINKDILEKFEDIKKKLNEWLLEKEKMEYKKLNCFLNSFYLCCFCCTSNSIKYIMNGYYNMVHLDDKFKVLTIEDKIDQYKGKLALLNSIDPDTDIILEINDYIKKIENQHNSLRQKTNTKVSLLKEIDLCINKRIKKQRKYDKNSEVLKIIKKNEKLKSQLNDIEREIVNLKKNKSGSSLDFTSMQINEPEKFKNMIEKFRFQYNKKKYKVLPKGSNSELNGEVKD